MAVLPIRKLPDPVLREPARPVEKIDKDTKLLIKNLADTMYKAPGVGLAANQVGVLRKVFVMDIGEGLKAYINPRIIWRSNETLTEDEACLSISSDVGMPIERYEAIKIEAWDEKGKRVEIPASGVLARVLQHELDHLDGKLIIDRTAPEERRKAMEHLSEL